MQQIGREGRRLVVEDPVIPLDQQQIRDEGVGLDLALAQLDVGRRGVGADRRIDEGVAPDEEVDVAVPVHVARGDAREEIEGTGAEHQALRVLHEVSARVLEQSGSALARDQQVVVAIAVDVEGEAGHRADATQASLPGRIAEVHGAVAHIHA